MQGSELHECQRCLLKSRHKVPIPKVLQCYGIMEKLLDKYNSLL